MLQDYVLEHTEKGACTCGKCLDVPIDATKKQPNEPTLDLTFFKIKAINNANDQEFLSIVKSEFPHWLDGKEHNWPSTQFSKYNLYESHTSY